MSFWTQLRVPLALAAGSAISGGGAIIFPQQAILFQSFATLLMGATLHSINPNLPAAPTVSVTTATSDGLGQQTPATAVSASPVAPVPQPQQSVILPVNIPTPTAVAVPIPDVAPPAAPSMPQDQMAQLVLMVIQAYEQSKLTANATETHPVTATNTTVSTTT